MEADRIANIILAISARIPRRTALGGALAAVTTSLLTTLRPPDAAARNRRKRKRKRRKVRFNEFGCVNVGMFCKTSDQCCSGICQGKKGKKTCRAHDTGGCLADQDQCFGSEDDACITTLGEVGSCFRTTGNASICANVGRCFPCQQDTDCEPFCGPGAACVVCANECGEVESTACLGFSACEFPVD